MIRKSAMHLANIIDEHLELDRHQQDKVRFTLEVILTDISKILILLFISRIMGISRDLMIVLLFSVPLRINVGGFHMKKYFSCLIFSSIYLCTIFYLNTSLQVETPILVVVGIICGITIFSIAPIVPRERVETTSMKIKQLKIRATILSIIYISLFTIVNNPYTRYGIWVIIIQTVLLLIAKGVKTNEKKIIKQATTTTL
jgi:accessory gene regulator B